MKKPYFKQSLSLNHSTKTQTTPEEIPMFKSRLQYKVRTAALALATIVSGAIQLASPSRAAAAAGDLYVTDLGSHSVLVFKPDGTSTVLDSNLVSPQGITFDSLKNLFVADAGDGTAGNGNVYKYVPPYTSRTTFAPGLTSPAAIAFNAGVNLLVAETALDEVIQIRPDGVQTPFGSLVTAPLGLLSNGSFVYIVSDGDVLQVASNGGGTPTVYYDHTGALGEGNALNVATDKSDNIFISTDAGVVLKRTPLGAQSDFATGFMDPRGMDFRPRRFAGEVGVGNLLVADTVGTIFQVTPGQVKTVFSTSASPNYLVFEVNPTPTPTPTPTVTPTPTATPTPTPNPTVTPVLFQNISTRAQVQTGDNVLIGGFIVTGGAVDKKVLLRAIGPSLTNANPPVMGALANPVLELHNPDGTIVTNDNWKSDQEAEIMATGLAPTNNLESAIVATLAPVDPNVAGSGQYTAIVRGAAGGSGIALVEVYDLDDPSVSLAQLANISTRGFVGSAEDALIGGIIVGPAENIGEVILRAIGPSLLNVTDPLQDPTIELVDSQGVTVTSNDNWQDSPNKDEIVARNLAPTADAEAAVEAVLPAGNYTAIVRSVDATSGVGLVEAYHILDTPAAAAK